MVQGLSLNVLERECYGVLIDIEGIDVSGERFQMAQRFNKLYFLPTHIDKCRLLLI